MDDDFGKAASQWVIRIGVVFGVWKCLKAIFVNNFRLFGDPLTPLEKRDSLVALASILVIVGGGDFMNRQIGGDGRGLRGLAVAAIGGVWIWSTLSSYENKVAAQAPIHAEAEEWIESLVIPDGYVVQQIVSDPVDPEARRQETGSVSLVLGTSEGVEQRAATVRDVIKDSGALLVASRCDQYDTDYEFEVGEEFLVRLAAERPSAEGQVEVRIEYSADLDGRPFSQIDGRGYDRCPSG